MSDLRLPQLPELLDLRTLIRKLNLWGGGLPSTTGPGPLQTDLGIFNVRDYGAKGNGLTDDTAAIQAALTAAGDAGGGTICVPPGVYLMDVRPVADLLNGPVLSEGVELVGAGYTSVLKINPASVAAQPNETLVLMAFNGRTRIRNLRVDGSRDAIEAAVGLSTGTELYTIRAADSEIADFQAHDLWIHDIYGATGHESFGIQSVFGANNWLYENIQCWNISGTGLHASGWDYDTDTRTNNIRFVNVQCWDCRWQGVSVFGAKDITMERVRCWSCGQAASNGGNAINIEVSDNVRLYGCVGTASKYGLSVGGPSTVYVYDCDFYANGETFGGFASDDAEVRLISGVWSDGVGNVVLSGPPTVVEFGPGTKITPTVHDFHIFSRARLDPVAAGNIPESIILSSEYARDWTFRVERIDSTGSALQALDLASFCNVEYPSAKIVQAVPFGTLSTLAQSGTMSITPYIGGGNVDPGAVTLASSVTTSQRRTATLLKSGHTYLVKVRCKPKDAGAWVLRTRTAAGSGNIGLLVLSQAPESVDEWFTGEMLVTADDDYRLQFQWTVTDDVTTSSLVVDYLTIVELVSDYGQSGFALPLVSADRGDASVTLQVTVDEGIQRFATTMTANRTITLSATTAYPGARFRVVRSATGAFTLSVGGLILLNSGQWAEVAYTGSAWILTATGLLAESALLASPTFTGTPAAPTATANTNTTQLATTAYVDRATTHTGTTSAAPTGTASATAVMMGLAGSFTPTRGTKVILMASGQMQNSVLGDGVTVDLRYGTGTAPTNGAAVTGTLAGIAQTETSTAAAQRSGFALLGKVTGLTPGTAYWFDISLLAITGGTSTATGVSLVAFEVP